MKIIACEEHFATGEYIDVMDARLGAVKLKKEYSPADIGLDLEMIWSPISLTAPHTGYAEFKTALQDIGEGRIRYMDKAGIDMLVLSLISPGVQELGLPEAVTLSRKINDELSEAVSKHPDRLAGLATVAPQAPEEAARELERAVLKLGLKGVCINSHTGGQYLDDEKYRPIIATAEKLDVPLYLHPRTPSPEMLEPYLKYTPLATAMLGFTSEINLHVMRLLLGGVLDRYPRLRIILGHLGETLPYLLWRLDDQWQKNSGATRHLQKIPSQYLKDNFMITTSGFFSNPAFLCAYQQLGADNIMFAVDSPMGSAEEGVNFIRSLAISDENKEKISHLNAERIFKL